MPENALSEASNDSECQCQNLLFLRSEFCEKSRVWQWRRTVTAETDWAGSNDSSDL